MGFFGRWNGAIAQKVVQRGWRPLPMCGFGIRWCRRTALLVRQGIRPFGTTPSLGTAPLPGCVTDFAAMREEQYRYVDKTAHIAGLLPPQGSRRSAYLCRPKGFGKTLFLSTLRYYFEGRKDLFEGLNATPTADKHPVLYLDMANMGSTEKDINTKLSNYISAFEERYSVTIIDGELDSRLENVWEAATMRAPQQTNATGGAVLLIDNFETPLVKSVGTPEEEGVRKFYKDFFPPLASISKVFFLLAVGTLPGSHIKSELFPEFAWGDVSSDPRWAKVCGFSMQEIRQTFADRIEAVGIKLRTKEVPLGTAKVLEEFERHYVGFDFHEPDLEPRDPARLLYRPNDVLRMLGVQTSSPEFWIQATPPVEESLPDSGTADFGMLRRANLVYVDKTSFIPKLLPLSENTGCEEEGNQYLLCRPPRFGKSLFCSMLRYYFEGRKDLFKGLDISKREETQWTARPVLHFDMTFGDFPNARDVRNNISDLLSRYEQLYGCRHEDDKLDLRLKHLIAFTFKKTGLAPVILIDEFDSAYHTVSDEDNDKVGEVYSEFVSPLKEQSNGLHLVLLVGIMNFAEFRGQSVFNHLNNISLDPKFAGVCGFTEDELESNYKVQIEAMAAENGMSFDATVEMFKHMYNGYRFGPVDEKEKVLNPVNVVQALQEKMFEWNWSNTMRSSLLQKVLEEYIEKSADEIVKLLPSATVSCAASDLLSGKNRTLQMWLYFLGYLTLSPPPQDRKGNAESLEMCYPNEEVKEYIRSLFTSTYYTPLQDDRETIKDLAARNVADLMGRLRRIFCCFPSFNGKEIFKLENAFQLFLYVYFSRVLQYESSGKVETVSSAGRSDLEVHFKKIRYIFELKLSDGRKARGLSVVETAAVQIISRKYWESYPVGSLVLVGVELDRENRSIRNWVHFVAVVPHCASANPTWRLVDFCRLKNGDGNLEEHVKNRWNDTFSNPEQYIKTKKAEENDKEAEEEEITWIS